MSHDSCDHQTVDDIAGAILGRVHQILVNSSLPNPSSVSNSSVPSSTASRSAATPTLSLVSMIYIIRCVMQQYVIQGVPKKCIKLKKQFFK